MALFKVFRGKREALDDVQKTDGHVYFCTDDGSFWIDYKDAENVLHRKSINESQMAALAALVDTMQKSIEDLEASLVGKVDYLGAVSSMEGLSTTAGRGDSYRVATEFEFGTEIAHVGDVISAIVDNPAQSILDWDLFHMEMGGSDEFVQSDWAQTDETAKDYIKNKPSVATDDEILAWLNEEQIVEPIASVSGEIYTTNNNELFIL